MTATKPDGGKSAPVSTPTNVIELSAQARQVSEIAVRNGDRDFLMVDKLRGEILFFKAGHPIFRGAALTGVSTADRLPPELLKLSYSYPLSSNQKITPAGRYTVTKQYDKSYGTIFEINEIQGKDWVLAIHPVFLGLPYEKRLLRWTSPSSKDNYITFGCINIGKDAIQFLTRQLPKKGKTPIYILPLDESLTSTFFSSDKAGDPRGISR